MHKLILVLTGLVVALTTAVGLAGPTSAAPPAPALVSASTGSASPGGPDAHQRASRTKCVRGSTSSSGTCYKFLASKKKVVPVEAVPMRNRSSRTAKFTCSFTRTIAKSVEYGASVTSSAEVSAVFGLAKLSIAATISKTQSQTETQASSVAGKVTLKPGQSVSCLRTYGSVIMTVQKYSYSGSRIVERSQHKVSLPSYLGVDIVD